MRSHATVKISELEPRATPTNELPSPIADYTTHVATAPVFTYVASPAPTNQTLDSVPKGDSGPGFTPPIEAGVALGVCAVLLVAGLLIYRFNKWRSNKRSKADQGSTAAPNAEPPAQHMSSRQREKMPASDTALQGTVDDDEIRPVTPQEGLLVPRRGGRVDDDSSSLMISPC
ncbi:hypothetical protein ACQKWADRAFT_281771 [Trichoderma austrokoningii]